MLHKLEPLQMAKAILFSSALAVFLPIQSWGQESENHDLVLPPLQAVVDQLLAFAPRIAEEEALFNKNEQLLDRASKSWLDGISFGVQTTAGSYGNNTLNELNLGVNAGASIRLSLFDILSQGDQKKAFKWQLEISRQMVRKAQVEETQYVTGIYRLIELAKGQLEVRADAWRASQIHREMAELEFANGNISVAELARVSEIEAKSHADYLAAVSEYRSWYDQLGVRIGAPLSSLLGQNSSN